MIIGDKVRKALIRLILGTVPAQVTGTVKSVDEGLFTCVVTPSDGGPDYEKVRLKVSINDDNNGMITIPEVNSLVIISPLFNNEHAYYVSRFSTIKKWVLKTVSGRYIDISTSADGKILINGDQHGGLPIQQKILDNMNVIKTYLNNLNTAIGTGLNAVGAGSSANGATGKAAFDTAAAALSITFNNDVNTNVKHG